MSEHLALAFEVDLAGGGGVVGFPWDSFRIQALLPLVCRRFLQQGWLWLPEEHLKIVLSRTAAAQ